MEEQLINWLTFAQLLPFMLAGLAVHIIDKVNSAKRRTGYSLGRFLQENALGYFSALIVCLVGICWMAGGLELIPGAMKIVVAFAIGSGGGSLIRSWVSKLQKK